MSLHPCKRRRREALAVAFSVVLLTTGCATRTETVEPTIVTVAPVSVDVDVDVEREVRRAVEAWITAIDNGNAQATWDLMSEPAQRAVGGLAGLKNLMPELEEGWATWARDDDRSVTVTRLPFSLPVDPVATDQVHVARLTGTIAKEGPETLTADSVPVRLRGGSAAVEPFVNLGNIRFPDASFTEVEPDHVFRAEVPEGVVVRFLIDSERPIAPDLQPMGQRRVMATYDPPRLLAPGGHTFTVVLADEAEEPQRLPEALSSSTAFFTARTG